ncbi:MAG: hypothetical protein QF645_05110 [Planctomycetota bacterium]|nr:hypothetical protein [Planctomycetota bacterium]
MKKRWALFCFLFMTGCQATNQEHLHQGMTVSALYYEQSTLEKEKHIKVTEGHDLTIESVLPQAKQSEFESARTPRRNFYLQFLKPEEIHEGLTLDFEDTSLLLYVMHTNNLHQDEVVIHGPEFLRGTVSVMNISESQITLHLSLGSNRNTERENYILNAKPGTVR